MASRALRLSARQYAQIGLLVLSVYALLWFALPMPSGAPQSQLGSIVEGIPPPREEYIEVGKGCGPFYNGEACVHTHRGPGDEYPVVSNLRRGIVLHVKGAALDGLKLWYRIDFNEDIRYPERLPGVQYVNADDVRHFIDDGPQDLFFDGASTSKEIIVDRSDQMLYAYEGEALFMETPISTGLDLTPTPRGEFRVFKKTPTRYMQGPLPGISDQYYDLPGVPWNLYFTAQGGAIHGAYWHESFGRQWSHGCVNVPLSEAERLYRWTPLGTKVRVRD